MGNFVCLALYIDKFVYCLLSFVPNKQYIIIIINIFIALHKHKNGSVIQMHPIHSFIFNLIAPHFFQQTTQ